ncbi:Retrotransposon Gag-like protein 9 [Labeo rohita]|uniref:Retrotransposon Gag-like protein 9 n=1 Tax=Labeo rohita TaxID=84645 RepID=A0ABQ8N0F9_LABRO|nr:Retrotransposon Gag-like protein 9 [Labeo rohita]
MSLSRPYNKSSHVDPLASRLIYHITEQSVTTGSSSFTPGQSFDMDTDRILCRIKQRSHTLEQYTREFISIANHSTLPDCIIIEIFCDGVNQPLRARLRSEGPRSSLGAFLNFALLCVGSPCTVGVAQRERDNAVMATARPTCRLAVMPEHDPTNTFAAWIAREMAAVQERAQAMAATAVPVHKMAATAVPVHKMAAALARAHKMAATAESVHKMAAETELRHVTAAIPEPYKVAAAFPESSQVSKPSQVAAVFPESSQVSKSSQVAAVFPESSQVPKSSQIAAVFPVSSQVRAIAPVLSQVTAIFPEPLHKMAATPEPPHKMAAVSKQLHKMATVSKPLHNMAAITEPVVFQHPDATCGHDGPRAGHTPNDGMGS